VKEKKEQKQLNESRWGSNTDNRIRKI